MVLNIKTIKIKYLFVILSFLIIIGSLRFNEVKAETLDTDIVTFADPNLEAVIRTKLAKPTGNITVGDMKGITGSIDGDNKNISDLRGIEYAVNVTYLYLENNQISDISPLTNMLNLDVLILNDNKISDISPLINVTNLHNLLLNNNQISDISPLSSLINLTGVSLNGNQISDISPLIHMTSLDYLELANNQISDISSLSTLVNLGLLNLNYNQITDVSPLSNIINLQHLFLNNNQITNISPLSAMVDLQWLFLNNNQITNISPLSTMINLEWLNLNYNQITNISSLSNMTKLRVLNLKNNRLLEIPNFISILIDLSYLDFSNNKIKGTLPTELNNLTNLKFDSGETDFGEYYTSFAGNQITGAIPSELKARLNEPLAFANNLLQDEPNQKQLTIKPDANLNLYLNSAPTQNMLRNVVYFKNNDGTFEESLYDLELMPTDSSFFDSSGQAIKSGTTSAYVQIKDVLESNTYAKTLTTVPLTISDKLGSNSDLQVQFTLSDSLSVTLDNNLINFNDVSSSGGEIQSIILTVSSSLPYSISTQAYGDFVGTLDLNNTIPIDKVSLDIDSLGYKELSKSKILNSPSNINGINKVHSLEFKISDTIGNKIDSYNSSIKVIVASI